MASLAGLLKTKGYQYWKRSKYLSSNFNPLKQTKDLCSPYSQDNITHFAPDLVVVGNSLSRRN